MSSGASVTNNDDDNNAYAREWRDVEHLYVEYFSDDDNNYSDAEAMLVGAHNVEFRWICTRCYGCSTSC